MGRKITGGLLVGTDGNLPQFAAQNRPINSRQNTSHYEFKSVTALFASETLGHLPDNSARKELCYQSLEVMNYPSIPCKRRKLRALSEATNILNINEKLGGGPSRNRTGVRGFAVRYVTTPPSGLTRCGHPQSGLRP